VKNLDVIAAKAAQQVIADTAAVKSTIVDGIATKSLGVIQENGIYAGMLFLLTRSKDDARVASSLRKRLLELASEVGVPGVPVAGTPDACLQYLTDQVCGDLEILLLVKQVWEQALIYTRYGAKALK
jgi:hypothetical protein